MMFRIHTHTHMLIFLLISAGAQKQEVLGVELKEMLNQNRGHPGRGSRGAWSVITTRQHLTEGFSHFLFSLGFDSNQCVM